MGEDKSYGPQLDCSAFVCNLYILFFVCMQLVYPLSAACISVVLEPCILQGIQIAEIIIHPDYWSDKTKHGNSYDLALIKLDKVDLTKLTFPQ